jgi:hypothetical protein
LNARAEINRIAFTACFLLPFGRKILFLFFFFIVISLNIPKFRIQMAFKSTITSYHIQVLFIEQIDIRGSNYFWVIQNFEDIEQSKNNFPDERILIKLCIFNFNCKNKIKKFQLYLIANMSGIDLIVSQIWPSRCVVVFVFSFFQ